MKVRIVCYEDVDAWILGKFARRMHENLIQLGIDSEIAKIPDPSADINHHIIYLDYDGKKTTTETVMITHIDHDGKFELVKRQMIEAELGICMSHDTYRQLVRKGVPSHKLCYVSPAHDRITSPRKIRMGITSKVQASGCKREHMLLELARRISPDDFEFFIMGTGWTSLVEEMRELGVEVEYHDAFNAELYPKIFPTFDYYLYFGWDEGSMGYLDALNAGVPTIVTPQGFHLDAIGGITHPFKELDELVEIFQQIAAPKNARIKSIESWSWEEYTRKHVVIWNYLLRRKTSSAIFRKEEAELKTMKVAQFKILPRLQAAFFSSIYKTHRKYLKTRNHIDAMVRYRWAKHVRGHG